jgi:hypothetical protein
MAQIEADWDTALASMPSQKEHSALVGAVIRLAFHDAGEFDGRFPREDPTFGTIPRPLSEPYGADGCLTEAGDHAGLTGIADEVNNDHRAHVAELLPMHQPGRLLGRARELCNLRCRSNGNHP